MTSCDCLASNCSRNQGKHLPGMPTRYPFVAHQLSRRIEEACLEYTPFAALCNLPMLLYSGSVTDDSKNLYCHRNRGCVKITVTLDHA